MSIRSSRDLEVWKRAMDLASGVYRLTATLPAHERYGLSSQLQRSAVSIPSNIAEGHARSSTRDYLRFLSIAQGSLAELETQIFLAVKLELCQQDNTEILLESCSEIGKMMSGLQRKLRQKLEAAAPAPGSWSPDLAMSPPAPGP